jgi:hypothetical protein
MGSSLRRLIMLVSCQMASWTREVMFVNIKSEFCHIPQKHCLSFEFVNEPGPPYPRETFDPRSL